MSSGQQGYLRQPRKPSGKVNQKMTGQRTRRGESAGEAEADLEDEEEGEEQPSEIKERSPRFKKDEEEEDENNNSQDQEGQRRVINVNKMPHLQSSKNRKAAAEMKVDLKKDSSHDVLELEDEQEEEDILPSLSSARQTHRRVNLSQAQ